MKLNTDLRWFLSTALSISFIVSACICRPFAILLKLYVLCYFFFCYWRTVLIIIVALRWFIYGIFIVEILNIFFPTFCILHLHVSNVFSYNKSALRVCVWERSFIFFWRLNASHFFCCSSISLDFSVNYCSFAIQHSDLLIFPCVIPVLFSSFLHLSLLQVVWLYP